MSFVSFTHSLHMRFIAHLTQRSLFFELTLCDLSIITATLYLSLGLSLLSLM